MLNKRHIAEAAVIAAVFVSGTIVGLTHDRWQDAARSAYPPNNSPATVTPDDLKKEILATQGAYLSVGYMAGTTLEECREIKTPTPDVTKSCDWAKSQLAHLMKGKGVYRLGDITPEK